MNIGNYFNSIFKKVFLFILISIIFYNYQFSFAQGKTVKKYTGQRISLDFQNAEISSILRIISDISKLNIVTPGNIGTTRITIKLDDVPWDQALDLILKISGLDKRQEGNILRIAPKEQLMKEDLEELAQKQRISSQIPTTVELIHVNYATVEEMKKQVESVLSDRGQVNVDPRTNVLIVKDTPEHVASAANLVESLDTQTPQILIESRIVEASLTFSRDLGIQWGGYYAAAPAYGNAPDVAFPSSITLYGAGGGNSVVNLPAPGGGGAGGAIGLSLGSISDALSLDFALYASETEGKAKVLANPKVVTLDNKAANISSGVQIPMTTVTAGVGGVATVGESMQNAMLTLSVTPHVTADESVFMKININKSSVNLGLKSPLGNPSIDTTMVTTEALVKNSDTLVIGGILQYQEGNSLKGVPGLMKLPVLGYLFKAFSNQNQRKELIIFITPRIVRTGLTE